MRKLANDAKMQLAMLIIGLCLNKRLEEDGLL
jgi:hypothetical protein